MQPTGENPSEKSVTMLDELDKRAGTTSCTVAPRRLEIEAAVTLAIRWSTVSTVLLLGAALLLVPGLVRAAVAERAMIRTETWTEPAPALMITFSKGTS